MTIQRDANIFTLEPGFDTLTISSGQSTSGWFDLKGLTWFELKYPIVIDGYQIIFSCKTEDGAQDTWKTNAGSFRSIIINTTTPFDDTFISASIEPSLTGGKRFFRVACADSSGNFVNQTGDRIFRVGARYIV